MPMNTAAPTMEQITPAACSVNGRPDWHRYWITVMKLPPTKQAGRKEVLEIRPDDASSDMRGDEAQKRHVAAEGDCERRHERAHGDHGVAGAIHVDAHGGRLVVAKGKQREAPAHQDNDYNADDYGEHHDHEVDVGEAAYHRVVLYFAQLIHHVDAAFLGEHVAAERDDSGHRSGKDLTEDDDHDVGQAAFTKSRGYGHDDRHHDKATGYGAKAVPVVHPEPFGKAEGRFPRSHLRGGDPVAVRHLRAHAPQEEHVDKGT